MDVQIVTFPETSVAAIEHFGSANTLNCCAACCARRTGERGGILQTTALEIEDGRIIAIYIVRNPDKLGHVAKTLH